VDENESGERPERQHRRTRIKIEDEAQEVWKMTRKELKRRAVILKNLLRRFFYLFTPTAFLSDCAFTAWDSEGRVSLIATVKQEPKRGTWQSTRVFYISDGDEYTQDVHEQFKFDVVDGFIKVKTEQTCHA
jgi:hypothetical protein